METEGPVPLALGASGQPGDLLPAGGQPYQGPKKSLRWLAEARPEAYALYSAALARPGARSGAVDRPPGGACAPPSPDPKQAPARILSGRAFQPVEKIGSAGF